MNMKHIIFSIALVSLTVNGYADTDTQLATVSVLPETSVFDNVSSATKSEKNPVSAVAGLRKYRSQVQFERTMRKYYPQGYQVLVGLRAEDRAAVYEKYRRGDRMDSVRIAVFEAKEKQ